MYYCCVYTHTGGKYQLHCSFSPPGVPSPNRLTPDCLALDTNNDNNISMADDMYTPYYPGDDAVDWVGMSITHQGEVGRASV